MQHKLFSNLAGDIAGGVSSAMLALPGSIIFGLLAFAPLGPDYVGHGILAGIYATIFSGIMSSLFASTEGLVTGPSSTASLVFASILSQLAASNKFTGSGEDAFLMLALAFMSVFLCGVFQLLFSILKIGKLVKFVSFPVVAGFMNGTFMIIVLKSVWDCIGVARQSWGEFFSNPGQINLLALVVAGVTFGLWIAADRFFPKIPGSIAALSGGTLLYYLFILIGLGDYTGGTLGVTIGSSLPSFRYFTGIFGALTNSALWSFFPIVLTAGLTMAILCSLGSLLVMLAAQNLTDRKADGNRELMSQGIVNMTNGLFGAIPAVGHFGGTTVSYKTGGRTRLVGIVFSFTTLLVVLMLSRFITYLPIAVIGGMGLRVGLLIMDKWSITLLKSVFRKKLTNRRELIFNIIIILLVILAVIIFDMITAVVLGIGLSIIMFVESMSRSVIRNIYRGSKIRSKKERYVKLMELLELHGNRIAIIELEGAFFFGVTDNLETEIDKLVEDGVDSIVLDMKRVTRIDVSGEKVLRQISEQLRKKNAILVFSYLYPGCNLWKLLQELGFIDAVGEENLFSDTDMALEFCEERIINTISPDELSGSHFNLQDFLGIKSEEWEIMNRIKKYFEIMKFNEGELVIKQGDPGDSAFIIIEGAVAVTIKLPGEEREKRLATLTFGTIIGEIALVDRGVRSADVVAVENTVCCRITSDDFDLMKKEAPDCAMRLRDAISPILVGRIRQANAMVAELER